MEKLRTIGADTLLYEPLEKPLFVVDGLIPTGLSLFCGSQKIGKSWLMLKLCLCVSQGIPFWGMPARAGDVLYLCLEDTFCRIQDRLFRLTDEANGRLHFAVASGKLTDGLIGQLEDFVRSNPDNYIDSLKAKIGQEADYAERMRDGKYEEELKVQKANQKILELQRTNAQMERLIKKIPPEVIEEIQKNSRNKSRER